MKLSILMAALRSRPQRMRPLIERQVSGRRDVELLLAADDGEVPSGAKRQRLLEQARGEYVAFVDDDDEVVPSYVTELFVRCTGVDVVTFCMDFVIGRRTAERWRLGLHPDDRPRGQMAANHLCAWRRELALEVSWSPVAYGDDQLWYGPLHASGLARTESHIPRTLYRYLWNAATTANQQPKRIDASRKYFGAGIPCYRDAAGAIYVAAGADHEADGHVRVYRRGELLTLPRSRLDHFHTVTLR